MSKALHKFTLASGITTAVPTQSASSGPAKSGAKSFTAKVAGTGAVTATVVVQVSNNNSDWDDLVTFTLSGTTSDNESSNFEKLAYLYYRVNVTAISGTGASVSVFGAEE
jgi:hypothetical protein